MALPHTRPIRRAFTGLAFLGVFLLLLHHLQFLDFSARRFETWEWTSCPGSSPFENSCTASRAKIAHDVQVVVKTGGSEPRSRLRSQLATVLSTLPNENIMIFSDMAEQVGGHTVRDVYADISEQERSSYPEFVLYEAQQKLLNEGRDRQDLQNGWLRGGWELAK